MVKHAVVVLRTMFVYGYRRPVMEMLNKKNKKNCLIVTRRVKTLRDVVCHTRPYIYTMRTLYPHIYAQTRTHLSL